MNRLLLGIDLQNDFFHPDGKLYVQGALDDLNNIISLINNKEKSFDAIIISMDTHYPVHVSHSSYWRNANGEMPAPFTNVSYQDILNKTWIPQYNIERCESYLKALEKTIYQCTIWPPHCLVGTDGWSLPKKLYETLSEWSFHSSKNFELYPKGSNAFTEHYSILKSAVEFDDVESTQLNQSLIDRFSEFDEIVVVGEAMDFCVASTIFDISIYAPELMKRTVILTDCMSNIIPNNNTSEKIYTKAQKLGAQILRSEDYLHSEIFE